MGHVRFAEPLSISSLTTALLTSGLLACSLIDDDEPPVADTGDLDPEDDACLAQLEAAEAQCLPGMTFHSTVDGGGGTLILIDDPGAAVGVGPGAWLVQVGAEADYVASQRIDGATCTASCGWCEQGESVCHQGFDENGYPIGCLMCLPYGTPDIGTQCAAFMTACTGLDETGAPDDEGVGETGAETDSGAMEPSSPDTFDCRYWDLEGAVVLDERGDVIVDAALIEMATAAFGEPLAQCDATRFRQRPDGYFEISALAASGLLARIGLEQGDVIVEVDGEPMQGADRVVSKAMDLFMGGRAAVGFTLGVRRRGEPITKVLYVF